MSRAGATPDEIFDTLVVAVSGARHLLQRDKREYRGGCGRSGPVPGYEMYPRGTLTNARRSKKNGRLRPDLVFDTDVFVKPGG